MSGVLRYQQVKDFILARIGNGHWRPGDRIMSEAELVRELGASRMTVNRAVRELAADGLLNRVAGAGTFVAAERRQAEFLEVKNIAVQLREQGKTHSAEVKKLEKVKAGADLARHFECRQGRSLFHVLLVHAGDGVPMQLEDRYVNPAVDPNFLTVDFTAITPSEHLIATAPVFEVEHMVEAVLPDAAARRLLGLDKETPCLQLTRRTWTDALVATFARFLHPAPLFKISTRFSYRQDGAASLD